MPRRQDRSRSRSRSRGSPSPLSHSSLLEREFQYRKAIEAKALMDIERLQRWSDRLRGVVRQAGLELQEMQRQITELHYVQRAQTRYHHSPASRWLTERHRATREPHTLQCGKHRRQGGRCFCGLRE